MASVLDILPDSGANFGTTSPQEDAGRPLGLVDKILAAFGHSVANGVMAPGRALASKVPITSDQMVAPAMDLTSMLTLGAGAAPAEANSLRMGIKAYHGSPHDFDKFDLSKIGMGEGAQAYGHGLYFAENEGVAKSYRDALSPPKFGDQLGNAADLVKQLGEDGALKAVQMALPRNPQLQVELDAIKSGAYKDWKPPGHMYEVNINADPAHFLDWDKPLSQQPQIMSKLPEDVRAQLQTIGKKNKEGWGDLGDGHADEYTTGKHLIDSLAQLKGDTLDNLALDHSGASAKLREAGIPGIKYLDQGSRTNVNVNDIRGSLSMWEKALSKTPNDPYAVQQVADLQKQLAAAEKGGTSNYVVFNDKLIDIMRKYGLAGMLGGAGLSQMPQDRQ